MRLTMCKSKLHRVTLTQAELNYEGSITIDAELLAASGILPFEKVQVVNINNGSRLDTYVYAAPAGSRTICLNGAAARLGAVGDKLIVLAYCDMEAAEAQHHSPTLVMVNGDNTIKEVIRAIPQPIEPNWGKAVV